MATTHFSPGKRFNWNGQTFEIRRLLPDRQANIENTLTSAFLTEELHILEKELFDGNLVFLDESRRDVSANNKASSGIGKDLSDFPQHLVDVARYRLWVIEPLIEHYPGNLTSQIVQSRIEEIHAQDESGRTESKSTLEHPLSRSSIYRWLRDYWISGKDLRALIPDTRKRGGKGKSRLSVQQDRIIEQTIEKLYYRREKVTIDDLLHEMARVIADENTILSANDQISVPSRSSIVRRVKALNMERVFRARRGKRAADREFSQSNRMDYPKLPLEEIQIDATKVDLIVVDEKDSLPLGRPTLMFAIDLSTRYPLGYYLGFEPEGYLPVLETLYQSILPKSDLTERYGTTNEWLSYGIPHTLHVVNSKAFRRRALEDACLELWIILKHGRPRAPHLRGAIERVFGTLNILFHSIPGTTFSNIMSRDDYPSGKLACVSLQALEEMLVKFLIDIYAQSHHRRLGDIPARGWEEALSNGFMPRVPQNAEDLLILLGRIEHRTINPYGIDLNSIRYNSAELAPIRTMIKKHPERFGRKVKLKYHPGNLSRIHVYDPFNDQYIEVPALDQEYTQGLSLWKHKVIQRYARLKGDGEDLSALGRAKQEIRSIVDEQKSQKKMASRARTARYEHAGKSPSLIKDQVVAPSIEEEIYEARRTLKVKESRQNTAGCTSVDSLDEPLDEGWSIRTKVTSDGSDNLRQGRGDDNDQ